MKKQTVYKDSLPALLPRLGCLPRLPGQRPAQLRAQCCTSSGEKHFQQELGIGMGAPGAGSGEGVEAEELSAGEEPPLFLPRLLSRHPLTRRG